MPEPGWVERRLQGEAVRPAPAPGDQPAAGGPPTCLRCGFPVDGRAMGCRNPCANCGTVYPLGDCSD